MVDLLIIHRVGTNRTGLIDRERRSVLQALSFAFRPPVQSAVYLGEPHHAPCIYM